MTAMKEALKKAGVQSIEDKLRDIILKAMIAHADNTSDTIDAVWSAAQKDMDLMIHLFVSEKGRVIGWNIRKIRDDIERDQTNKGRNRPLDRRAALVVNNLRDLDLRQDEEDERRNRESMAAYRAEQDAVAEKWRATHIGLLSVDGRPIWEITVGTARVWLESQIRRWRTVELLIEGLPNDDKPISYYRKPEEVHALWRLTGDRP